MNDDNNNVKCECKCELPSPAKMLIITNDTSPCCQSNTIELINNNNLQTYNKELQSDITSFAPSITISDINELQILSSKPFSSLRDHVPRTGIPVLISSLRI